MSSRNVHERATSPTRHLRWALVAGTLAVGLGLGAYVLANAGRATTKAQAAPAPSRAQSSRPAGAVPSAPNGAYTTPAGTTATIAGLRGTPTMVWFVAGGCASCAASIPAVAAHLRQLTRTGLRVLTLGLYGAFPTGKAGAAAVLSFGEAAAGKGVAQPGWSWGMASKQLSLAYDPAGVPDLYVLIGPAGHIRFRDNVPVSTMSELLAQAKRLAVRAEATVAVRPCCP